jgi:hypothetical protein
MESSNHDEDNMLVANWSEQNSNRGAIEMFKDLSKLSEETQKDVLGALEKDDFAPFMYDDAVEWWESLDLEDDDADVNTAVFVEPKHVTKTLGDGIHVLDYHVVRRERDDNVIIRKTIIQNNGDIDNDEKGTKARQLYLSVNEYTLRKTPVNTGAARQRYLGFKVGLQRYTVSRGIKISELVHVHRQQTIMVRDENGIVIQYDHCDEDRRNNRPSNLQALPQTENCKKAQRNKKRRDQDMSSHQANVYYVRYESHANGQPAATKRAILYGQKGLDESRTRNYANGGIAVVSCLSLRTRERPVTNGTLDHRFTIMLCYVPPGKEDFCMHHVRQVIIKDYERQLKVLEDPKRCIMRRNTSPCYTHLEFTGTLEGLFHCLGKLAHGLQDDFEGFTINLVNFCQRFRRRRKNQVKKQWVEVVSAKGNQPFFCIQMMTEETMDTKGI